MIIVKELESKQDYEPFNVSAQDTLFLQSWNYGEQVKALGDKVFRIGMYEKNKLIGIAQVIIIRAKRGDHYFIPYGPVLKKWKQEYFEACIDFLRARAKSDRISFIRVSPFISNTKKNRALFQELGFVNSPMHVVAENTWLLSLDQDEKELLKQMRKNNRKLIKRAERDGVTIEKSTTKEAIEEFVRLHKDTKKKHNFTPYPDDFFRKQVQLFAKDNQVLVINARYKDEVIGSAIVMYYGSMAAYHHGANSIAHQKIPAAYLIQWEAILEAKKRGIKTYNFWGVSPDKDRPHPISGVSHFKRGFGGKQHNLLHAQDLPLQISYGLNWIIETIRRKRRGYYFVKPE